MGLEDLVKDKYQATGYKSICRKCNREKARKWRKDNPEKARENIMKWREENREYWLEYLKYLRNPDDHLFEPKLRDYGRTPEEARKWMKENKKRYDQENADRIYAYIEANRPRINYTVRERRKKKRKNDPEYRLKECVRRQFTTWVKSQGVKRSEEYNEIVGCSFHELKIWIEKHFEPGMTWENHGKLSSKRVTWQIDHHYPVSHFNFLNPEHVKQCFHYTNLYPVWAKQNNQKSDSVPEHPRENLYIPDFAKIKVNQESQM